MRRRLLSIALVALVAVAGCASAPAPEAPSETSTLPSTTPSTTTPPGEVDEEYDDRVDTVQAAPGETTTITLDLHDVGELYLPPETDDVDESAPVTIETGWGRLSPEPARVVETLPPYWVWETVQPNVSVTVTVQVNSSTTPGTYDVVYEAYDDTSHDHETGTFGTIRVDVVEK